MSSLGTTASVQPAIAAAWDIVTPLLKQAANAAILYGVVMIAGAWLAGRTRLGRRRPHGGRRRTCATRRSPTASSRSSWSLLLWWGPTPATRNPSLALLLIVLMAIGTEVLRRQIVREHPDARRGDTLRRVRGAVGAGAGRAWAGHARAPRAAAPRWPARLRAWPRTEAEAEAARTPGSTSSSGSPGSRTPARSTTPSSRRRSARSSRKGRPRRRTPSRRRPTARACPRPAARARRGRAGRPGQRPARWREAPPGRGISASARREPMRQTRFAP